MAIATGTQLGSYEVLSAIGAGGMGEVYKARDLRLDRIVAIKVLSTHLTNNQELKARFDREARSISSLQHPHICVLYDIGHDEASGLDYLVMEYLEGETLVKRLERGALPNDQVLRVAMEIADALDRAHRQGITHRDLKPGNIILTKGGAKLLDFGLAKPAGVSSKMSLSAVATMTSPADPITQQGVMVGTMQYMSPEQIEGKEADSRSDIFAFGAVLYEMATGQRAFNGKSHASIIAAILTSEPPPLSQVQNTTGSAALESLIRTCLAKDPDDRYQSAHDLVVQLRWISKNDSSVLPLMERGKARLRRRWMEYSIAGALIVLAAVAGWFGQARSSRPLGLHATIVLPEGTALPNGSMRVMDWSPDAATLVFAGTKPDGSSSLYTRRLDSFEATPIKGTDGAFSPMVSPDGASVAFYSRDGTLKRVPISGGTPTLLKENLDSLGFAWAEDDTIYTIKWAQGITATSASGVERKVTECSGKDGDRSHLWPQLLPGEKSLLFTTWTGASFDDARIEVVNLADGKRTVLVKGGTYGQYLASGHLLFARGGTVFAVQFDPGSLTVKGSPVPVLQGVATGAANGDARFAISAKGHLAYVTGTMAGIARELVLLDRTGKAEKVSQAIQPYGAASLSPDGRFVLTTIETSTFDIWMLDRRRDTMSKTSFGADDTSAIWSPDGKSFAYVSSKTGNSQIYLHTVESGADIPLTSDKLFKDLDGWLPDGSALVIEQRNPETDTDIELLSLADKKTTPLVVEPFRQASARVSPDGKWLTFASNESGKSEVYVRALRGGPKTQLSRDGGNLPRWGAGGKEVIYLAKEKVMSVALTFTPELEAAKPLELFSDSRTWNGYQVLPDGRILTSRDLDSSRQAQINVILNWTKELERK
jgi:eukaryotic-like serine/threonine-protein kinase